MVLADAKKKKNSCLSARWVFEVGNRLHCGSFGKKQVLGISTSSNSNNSKTTSNAAPANKKWSSADFGIRTTIGMGQFGTIYRAVYKGGDDGQLLPPKKDNVIALKCFAKSKLLRSENSRSLELLRREVNIQSQYVI